MTPFSPDEVEAWVAEQFEAVLAEQREDYQLKDGEFTAAMYAEWTGLPMSTANRRLQLLRDAQRIPHKRVKMDAHWVWVYWKED